MLQSKLTGPRKFTLRYQFFGMTCNFEILGVDCIKSIQRNQYKIFLNTCTTLTKITKKNIFDNLPKTTFSEINKHFFLFCFSSTAYIHTRGRVAQSVGHLTRKSVPSLATYFRFSFRFFKKGSCQLLAKVCARSTG